MSAELGALNVYVNVQMASEASDLSSGLTGDDLRDVLIDGNRRSSKFTETGAADFSTNWTVVEHRSNTATGFSGTLFRYTGPTDTNSG